MKRIAAILFGVLSIVISASADTIYVWTNSPSDGPGTAWSNAFHTIQGGVDAASSNDTVLVTNGTYTSGSQITVAEAVTVESVNGRDVTIVDGGNSHRCFHLGNYACTISGFTITNGYASSSDGGGVYCTGTTPVITNCTLSGNSAGNLGGGSYYGTLNNCTVSGNSAGVYGGGSCYGTLNNCTLTGNWSDRYGGGSARATLNNCTLTGNSADDDGGGSQGNTLNNCTLTGNMASRGGGSHGSTLNSCTITGNSAFTGGGSSYDTLNNCALFDNEATAGGGSYYGTLNNCIIWDNFAHNEGGGSYRGTLTNCIIWGNGASISGGNWSDSAISFSCTVPLPGGTGNIDSDPQFVNAASNNFRLSYGSPCIDAGTDLVDITNDLDRNPRPVDGDFDGTNSYDMGAYAV